MVNAEHGGTPPSSPSPDSFASLFAGLSSVDNTWEAASVDADASLCRLPVVGPTSSLLGTY